MPRPPPKSEDSAEGTFNREPMITSNDLFYAAKGPEEWHSSPKYIGQLSSAPNARKEVHTPDNCGEDALPPHFVLSGIGRNKDGSRNGKLHVSLSAGAEESHFSSSLNAFLELEMGAGLLFSSSIYQRACCHPVGSSSNQNTFPSTDFLFTNHGRRGCVPKPSCTFLSRVLYVAAPAYGVFPKSVHPPLGPIASTL